MNDAMDFPERPPLDGSAAERYEGLVTLSPRTGTWAWPELHMNRAAGPQWDPGTHAYGALRSATSRGARFVTLSGPTGTGKTGAAVGLLWHNCGLAAHVRHNQTLRPWPRYIEAPTLLDLAFQRGNDARGELARIERAGVLIVDDVGTENDWADKVAGYYDGLVNRRYTQRLVTILTTNLTLEQMRAHTSDRVLRRITEGESRWVMLDDSDVVRPRLQQRELGEGES